MTPIAATSTCRLFQHDRVAAAYASARPYLHPEVFARVRDLIGLADRLRCALDVGCGTGLSSVALLGLARHVVGIDAALDMLRRARRVDGVRYAACQAEALPFQEGVFDLILACGAMSWVDRRRFVPRAAQLLVSGGWLVSLDFGDTGRSPDVPRLAHWREDVFQPRYPRPQANAPIITADEAERHGFAAPLQSDFAVECSFTAARYAGFLMSESNVIAAIEYGDAVEGQVHAWIEAELLPLFGRESRRVTFGGYIQALRKR